MPMVATGSTDAYRGTEGALEMTMMLSKKELKCEELIGPSYDTLIIKVRDLFASDHHHMCHHDNYCLFISVQLECPLDKTAVGVFVPSGAMTDKIIRLYINPIIQIVILNNTDFLIYKGHRSRDKGITYDKAASYVRHLVGSCDWAGFPVVVKATPLMITEGKSQISEA